MPIYEVGEVAGYHYIAMKYIQGRTLKQLLQQEGSLPVARAAQILAQVGEVLMPIAKGLFTATLNPRTL